MFVNICVYVCKCLCVCLYIMNNYLEPNLHNDINILKQYFDKQNTHLITSSHAFENDCNNYIKNIIKKIRCSENLIKYLLSFNGVDSNYRLMYVCEMNELYSSRMRGLGSDAGSDAVFQENHIDGPFGFIPFLTLIRCIVTIYNETEIKTNIKGKNIACKMGEFIGHDYNRDLHFIYGEQLETQKRYVLKLHYILYPEWMPFLLVVCFKYLNTKYNSIARKLFLYTINPKTYGQKVCTFFVNFFTVIYAKGFNN